MRFAILLFVLTQIFGLKASASPLEEKADFMCETVLNKKPFVYSDHFAAGFVQALPEDYFLGLMNDVIGAIDLCEKSEILSGDENQGVARLTSVNGRSADFLLVVDKDSLISGLQVQDVNFPDVVIDSFESASNYVNSLDAEVTFTVENFDKGVRVSNEGFKAQPLGSAFKLYVLGALADEIARGTYSWDQNFPIKNEWKSLPSGVLQNEPEGKEFSLKELAEYMIKISDNTATDHLIHIVGREIVENQLVVMNNNYVELNRPFLTTSEMFKLKWAAPQTLIDQFKVGDSFVRRSILENQLVKIDLNQVGTNGVSQQQPAFISEIEWFGGTNDVCSGMRILKNKQSPEILDVLSQNVPFLDLSAQSLWNYGGFKGGSEPGVLTMSFLLESKKAEWGCVSVAWSDQDKPANQWVMFDLVSKLLRFSENYF